MKVLLNDGLDKDGITLFEEAGIETDIQKRDLERLVKESGQFDGLVVRSATEVTRDVIEAGAQGNLKIVGRGGVGYDNIDVDAASKNGIVVKYAPSGNTISAAELALVLMLDVSRKVPQAHYTLRNGVWRKKPFTGTELSGKTLGIIGCGRIGQKLAQLTLGFNMPVIGYDKQLERVKQLFPDSRIRYVFSKEEVLQQADYVSLHTGGNNIIIGAQDLAVMKPTAYLINTSRGSNVDENELYQALKEKRIAGAGIDVYAMEPEKEGQEFDHPFRGLDNVVLTSHLGASTKEAQVRTSIEIARVVIDYLVGEDIFVNVVNAGETVASEQRPTYRAFIHHKDTPGAFARIDSVLADHGINIRDNPSRQLGRDGSAITVYRTHQPFTSEVLAALRKLGIVYRVTN